MNKKKTYTGHIEFKADSDETGVVTAKFATLNVVDHDGDVTLPGAFHDGQGTMIEAWNHNYGALPVGKGVIREFEDKAVFEGRFFLDTTGGREHYEVVKALGDLQEWSYTFQVEEADYGQFDGQDVQFLRALDVWGVAPVQRGAGIDTRTRSIKSAGASEDDDPGADDTTDGDEGQGGGDVVEPSGPPPGVVATRIQIDLLEV